MKLLLQKLPDYIILHIGTNDTLENRSRELLFLVLIMRKRKKNLEERLSTIYKSRNFISVHIDYKLRFDKHIETLRKKVAKKLHSLAGVIKYMSANQPQMLMRHYIMSQFCYCPLICMCHSRKINNPINKLHECSLRLAYNNKSSSFRDFFEKNKSVTIHERNI